MAASFMALIVPRAPNAITLLVGSIPMVVSNAAVGLVWLFIFLGITDPIGPEQAFRAG